MAENYSWESVDWYWCINTDLNGVSTKPGSIVTKTVNDNGKMVTVTGNNTIFEVTKKVNGGTSGIVDRIKYYNLIKSMLRE